MVGVGSERATCCRLQGNDIIWTTKDFEPDLAHYSIFSVARYSGNNNRNRVISSRGRNWFFGFQGNTIRRFHSDGWAWNQGGADQNWHIHIGDVNDQDQANFWLDGTHLAKNSYGLHDTNYKPRNINLGNTMIPMSAPIVRLQNCSSTGC